MQVCVYWSVLLVPALAIWAILGMNLARETHLEPVSDAMYFLIMLVIGALTWRTVETHDACFLIHTASLGIMIVYGVLPRKGRVDETFHWA
jgi:hypothetical protein